MWPYTKKSQGFNSGERGGHGIGPFLSNHFFLIYFHLTFCLEEKRDEKKCNALQRLFIKPRNKTQNLRIISFQRTEKIIKIEFLLFV
jgi:hypothetical protein